MNWQELQEALKPVHNSYAAEGASDAQKQAMVQKRIELVNQYHAANRPQHHHHAPPPSPPPPPPPPPGQKYTNAGVKIPDVVVSTYDYSQATVEELEKLYFQNVGGTEILTVARHDNVNGQEVPLSYLDNLKELNTEFNPLNILTTENIYNHFNRFAIDMTQRIDSVNRAVAVDAEGSNIVITLDEIQADEYVQIQVANVANDTEFGDGIVWRNYYGEVK
jgi:Leucine-rich repeat (LRR) protein